MIQTTIGGPRSNSVRNTFLRIGTNLVEHLPYKGLVGFYLQVKPDFSAITIGVMPSSEWVMFLCYSVVDSGVLLAAF